MANWYVSSVKHAAIAQWAASTAYTVGQLVRQLAAPTAANSRVFKCTTAGTSGASEPSWNLTDGATTVSGTATFTQVAGRESEQSSGNWAAPLGTLAAAHALLSTVGDVVYVANDHSESYAAGADVQGALGVPRICVVAGSTVPPTAAELSRGASIETTGNNSLNMIFNCLYRGFNFKSGVGGTNTGGNLNINASCKMEDCRVSLLTSSTSALMNIGGTSISRGYVEMDDDCRLEFAATGQTALIGFSEVLVRNCDNLITGAITPSVLFGFSSSNGARGILTVRDCDLSAFNTNLASNPSFGMVTFENCKIHASATFGSGNATDGVRNNIRVHNCTPSSSITNALLERGRFADLDLVTDVVRTGGATDGVTQCSWRLATKASANAEGNRTSAPRIAKRITAVGSPKTFTVEALVLVNSTFDPTRRFCFGEFFIPTSATSPVNDRLSTRSSFLDSTALQTSTSSWTGAPARTNSTSRLAGYVFSVASNPGRIFVVTTSGTSAGSEPAAYATAVDGDTFADGTSTVHVARRVKFEVTATPARRGMACFSPQLNAVSGSVIYIDPKIVVT